jgi:hypothetical protein
VSFPPALFRQTRGLSDVPQVPRDQHGQSQIVNPLMATLPHTMFRRSPGEMQSRNGLDRIHLGKSHRDREKSRLVVFLQSVQKGGNT